MKNEGFTGFGPFTRSDKIGKINLKQRKVLKNVLEVISSLIDIYDEDTSEIDGTNAYFVIHVLLKIIDEFVTQPEAREVLNLLTEAKDIAEDESGGLDNEGNIDKRYGTLYERVEALKAELDNKPLGEDKNGREPTSSLD